MTSITHKYPEVGDENSHSPNTLSTSTYSTNTYTKRDRTRSGSRQPRQRNSATSSNLNSPMSTGSTLESSLGGSPGSKRPPPRTAASGRNKIQHASSCAISKRDREERMKMIREKQKEQQEKREAALREAEDRELKRVAAKEVERVERIKKLRERDTERLKAVTERRKKIEMAEQEKREALLAKYRAHSENRSNQRDKSKPVYAFGSSTPRVLAYLENLHGDQKIYNTKLASEPLAPEELEALKMEAFNSPHNLSSSFHMGRPGSRSSSALPSSRHRNHGSDSPDTQSTPSRSLRSRPTLRDKSKLTPSSLNTVAAGVTDRLSAPKPRPTASAAGGGDTASGSPLQGASMTSSLYVNSAPRRHKAPPSEHKTAPRNHIVNDIMTQSLYASPAPGNVDKDRSRNPRRKTPSARRSPGDSSKPREDTPAAARRPPATPKTDTKRTPSTKTASSKNDTATKQKHSPCPNGNTLPDEKDGKTKRSSSARKAPVPTTPIPSKKEKGAKGTTSPTSANKNPADPSEPSRQDSPPSKETSVSQGVESASPSPPGTPPDQKRARNSTDDHVMDSANQSASTELGTPSTDLIANQLTPPPEPMDTEQKEEKLTVEISQSEGDNSASQSPVEDSKLTVTMATDSGPESPPISNPPVEMQQQIVEKEDMKHKLEENNVPTHTESKEEAIEDIAQPEFPRVTPPPLVSDEDTPASQADDDGRNQEEDMRSSFRVAVPTPTGNTGQVKSAEEAKNALAEKRRLAREAMEREQERERQIAEEERRKEEERIRLEEEEFRRQEAEEIALLEEVRRDEEARLAAAIAETEKRKAEEREREKAEEKRRAEEEEEKQRIEKERQDKEMKEMEEKFKREQTEREERKKRLSMIMSRTRQGAPSPSSTSTNLSTLASPASLAVSKDVGSRDPTPPPSRPTPVIENSNGITSRASASVLQKLATTSPALENILNRHKSNPSLADQTDSQANQNEVDGAPSFGGNSNANANDRMTMSEMNFNSHNYSSSEDTARASESSTSRTADLLVRFGSSSDEKEQKLPANQRMVASVIGMTPAQNSSNSSFELKMGEFDEGITSRLSGLNTSGDENGNENDVSMWTNSTGTSTPSTVIPLHDNPPPALTSTNPFHDSFVGSEYTSKSDQSFSSKSSEPSPQRSQPPQSLADELMALDPLGTTTITTHHFVSNGNHNDLPDMTSTNKLEESSDLNSESWWDNLRFDSQDWVTVVSTIP